MCWSIDRHRLTSLVVRAPLARRIVILIVLLAANVTAGLVSSLTSCHHKSELRMEAVFVTSHLDLRLELTYRRDMGPSKYGSRRPGEASEGLAAPGHPRARLYRLKKERVWRKDMLTGLVVSASLF